MDVKTDQGFGFFNRKKWKTPPTPLPSQEVLDEDEWMIRPCYSYKDEYSDCTSVKSRFQQYFIYGETQDCSHWRRDYNNCLKWKEDLDYKARCDIIQSEQKRRDERLKAHFANDIWENRTEPPDDWNKPLPQRIVDRDANSYLDVKAKKLRGEPCDDIDIDENRIFKYCTIM